MSILSSRGNALCVASAVALLAGSVTATSQTVAVAGTVNVLGRPFAQHVGDPALAPQRRDAFLNKVDAKTNLVYITDYTSSTLNVFTERGVQVGQIVNGLGSPEGIFVDSQSNVWVANTGMDNVLVFPRGAISPTKVLTDPIGYPVDVTMCNNGTVYVANLDDNLGGSSNSASVQVYPPGRTTPSRSLKWANDFRNPNLTCDAAGNVFVSIDTQQFAGHGEAHVIEFPGGKQAGAKEIGVRSGAAGGIKPDNAGNLLVSDVLNQTITEYTEAGQKTGLSLALGTPVLGLALTRDGQTMLGAAPNLPGGESWSFPSGKPEVLYTCCSRISLPFQFPAGVAYDPGQNL